MFKSKKVDIPLRSFYCELKHRPPGDDGSNEELIDVLELKIPRLKNSDMEKQWAFAHLWNKLNEPEFLSRDINQVFIFTAQFGELLMRMEVQPFTDEPSQKLQPPEKDSYSKWQEAVEKRFKKLYGISIAEWRENAFGTSTKGDTRNSVDQRGTL